MFTVILHPSPLILETLHWMYPAFLYAKVREYAAGCGFDMVVDVVKKSIMSDQEIK